MAFIALKEYTQQASHICISFQSVMNFSCHKIMLLFSLISTWTLYESQLCDVNCSSDMRYGYTSNYVICWTCGVQGLVYNIFIVNSWKRHVKLRTISGLLRAEVIYITPAGRKLRTYGEVEKALEVMDTNMTKDNFSFSNKLQVGTFYLPCESQVGIKDMP